MLTKSKHGTLRFLTRRDRCWKYCGPAPTKVVDQELVKHPVDKLFTPRHGTLKPKSEWGHRYNVEDRRADPTMMSVAQKYALAKEEFEYFFTIASHNRQERVEHPYHVL